MNRANLTTATLCQPSRPGIPTGMRGDMSLLHAIVAYLNERQGRGQIAPRTRATHWHVLTLLDRHTGGIQIERLSTRHVDRWLQSLTVAPSTRYRYISTVRSFTKWAYRNGLVATDPCASLRPGGRPKSRPRQINAEDAAAVLAACPDARARLIVTLMWRLAMRAGEVAALRWEDIDWSAGTIIVRGKGAKERTLPLIPAVVRALDEWHVAWPCARVGPVLRSYLRPSQGLPPKRVSVLVAEWCAAAGVHRSPWDGRTAHAFRHGRAGAMLRQGAHLRAVQQTLGHQSLETTAIYLPELDVRELRSLLDDESALDRVMEGRSYRMVASGDR